MSEAEQLAGEFDWWVARGLNLEPRLADAAAELRRLSAELEGHKAARTAYASEFPLNGEGEPDVGSIHQNIRALKAELAALKKAQGVPDGLSDDDLSELAHSANQEAMSFGLGHDLFLRYFRTLRNRALAPAPPAPQAAVCKGDWMLGTACGKCSRCIETKPAPQAEELLQWKARALQAEAIVEKLMEPQASVVQQEPIGFMNAGHVYELQKHRVPYGYVYPEEGAGAHVAVYTHPAGNV